MSRAFCSVVTLSHVPYVRALGESLQAAGNTEPLRVLVADAEPATLPTGRAGLEFLALDQLGAAFPATMPYYFDAFEFTNALKPFLVSHLLRHGCEQVIYLDSDIIATSAFAPVWTESEQTALVLTPHQLAPPPRGLPHTNEIEIVDQGLLNGGFAAWRRGSEATAILDWLCDRLPVHGFCDRAAGMFVDQKLLPLIPVYFPAAVRISRNPRLNVAFWNAHERAVRFAPPSRWEIEGEPVVFFHLSGYRLNRPGVPCSYLPAAANAALLRDAPWFAAVLARYHDGLERAFAGHLSPAYRFRAYEGTTLTPELRRLLFRTGRLERTSYAFWRIRVRDTLKQIKRGLLRRR